MTLRVISPFRFGEPSPPSPGPGRAGVRNCNRLLLVKMRGLRVRSWSDQFLGELDCPQSVGQVDPEISMAAWRLEHTSQGAQSVHSNCPKQRPATERRAEQRGLRMSVTTGQAWKLHFRFLLGQGVLSGEAEPCFDGVCCQNASPHSQSRTWMSYSPSVLVA